MFEKNPIIRWRKYNNYYFLEADKCERCNKIHYSKGYICDCGNTKFKKTTLSKKGKLLTYTQITTPPISFLKTTPYYIGIIELEEGIKITAQITDINMKDIYVGMPVKAEFRKIYETSKDGIINYSIKFTPLV